jgi:hypothetical protein
MPHPDAASDSPLEQTLPQDGADAPTLQAPYSPTDVTLKQPDIEPALPELPPRFEAVRRLGAGAYGLVLQTIDHQRQMPVALKLLRQAEIAGLATFKQEFYTLADLHHPNIITLYELFAADPPWFFTMELLDGATHFHSYVRSHPGEVRSAVGQLAVGVAALHAAGKLHRDLKSSNVLVTPTGRVVVTDFGLATPARADDGCGPCGLVGTVPYMAPEQGADQPVTPASDWYSVGVMLYEVLTGRLPFERSTGSMWDYLRLKLETDPPPPSEVVHGLPADLNDLCVALLRREPTARPTGTEVCRRLGVTPPSPPRPPFVGRTQQLAELKNSLAAARSGRTVAACVHGRSGSGKSALIDRFLCGLDERGDALVLTGRCYEYAAVPFKALDGLADSLARYLRGLPDAMLRPLLPRDTPLLARVFPVLQTVRALIMPVESETARLDPRELRRRAFAALRDLLSRLGNRLDAPPLVLAVDDLQWGDTDSAEQLVELMRPPDAPPLLFVASFREEDETTSPCLQTLFAGWGRGGPEVRRVAVGPLADEEARQLAGRLLGPAVPAERLNVVVGEAAGNPLFVAELARLSAAEPRGGVSLEDVLEQRVEALHPAARKLLEVTALAARPITVDVSLRAAGLNAEDQAALWTLRAERLVRGAATADHEEVEVYHDSVRRAVLLRTDPDAARAYQRGLAEALESAEPPADPEWVAVLWDGAGDPGRAVGHFLRAARQAADAFAFDRAARIYREALERLPADAPERHPARVALGTVLAAAGRGAESAREYLTATSEAAPAEALNLRQRAATQLLLAGHFDEALQLLRGVLAAVGLSYPKTPARAIVSLLYQRAVLWFRGLGYRERPAAEISSGDISRLDTCSAVALGLSMIDPLRGADFQTRYLLLALRAGEPARVARALAYEAGYAAAAGVPAKAKADRLLADADALAQRIGDIYVQGVVQICRSVVGYLCCDWQASIDAANRADDILRERCAGGGRERDTFTAFSLYSLYFRGDLAELSRRLPAVVRDAEERGDRFALSSLGTFAQPMAALCQDDPESVRAGMEAAISPWTRQAFQIPHYNDLVTGAQVELYAGRPEAAWGMIQARGPALRASQLLRVQIMRVIFERLRAEVALALAARTGEAAFARAARAGARRLERETSPMAQCFALILRGGLANLSGDPESAARHLEEAAKACEAADMHLYAAAAQRHLGELRGDEALVKHADEWMRNQEVRNPARMTGMLAPGWK